MRPPKQRRIPLLHGPCVHPQRRGAPASRAVALEAAEEVLLVPVAIADAGFGAGCAGVGLLLHKLHRTEGGRGDASLFSGKSLPPEKFFLLNLYFCGLRSDFRAWLRCRGPKHLRYDFEGLSRSKTKAFGFHFRKKKEACQ